LSSEEHFLSSKEHFLFQMCGWPRQQPVERARVMPLPARAPPAVARAQHLVAGYFRVRRRENINALIPKLQI
jgi:hypothetical protein